MDLFLWPMNFGYWLISYIQVFVFFGLSEDVAFIKATFSVTSGLSKNQEFGENSCGCYLAHNNVGTLKGVLVVKVKGNKGAEFGL